MLRLHWALPEFFTHHFFSDPRLHELCWVLCCLPKQRVRKLWWYQLWLQGLNSSEWVQNIGMICCMEFFDGARSSWSPNIKEVWLVGKKWLPTLSDLGWKRKNFPRGGQKSPKNVTSTAVSVGKREPLKKRTLGETRSAPQWWQMQKTPLAWLPGTLICWQSGSSTW